MSQAVAGSSESLIMPKKLAQAHTIIENSRYISRKNLIHEVLKSDQSPKVFETREQQQFFGNFLFKVRNIGTDKNCENIASRMKFTEPRLSKVFCDSKPSHSALSLHGSDSVRSNSQCSVG